MNWVTSVYVNTLRKLCSFETLSSLGPGNTGIVDGVPCRPVSTTHNLHIVLPFTLQRIKVS